LSDYLNHPTVLKFFKDKNVTYGDRYSQVSYGYVYDNDKLDDLGVQPCHGRAASISWLPTVFMTRIRKPVYKQKSADVYNHWLVNDSPFAKCFFSKDVDYINSKGFVMDVDQPWNTFFGACVASRFTFDRYCKSLGERNKVFDNMLDYGFSPSWSYLLAHFLNKDNDGFYTYSPLSSPHTIFNASSTTWMALKNFFDPGYKPKLERSYKIELGWRPGYLFSYFGETRYNHHLDGFFKKVKLPSSLKKRSLNVFEKQPTTELVIKNAEDLHFLVDEMKKEMQNAKS
jgi:hypothetical protein